MVPMCVCMCLCGSHRQHKPTGAASGMYSKHYDTQSYDTGMYHMYHMWYSMCKYERVGEHVTLYIRYVLSSH